MVFRERTYSVLLVSASGSFLTSLQPMLPMTEYWPVTTVTSISSARRALVEKPYDLIIINAPLRDEFGTRFAIDVSAKSSAIVLLFVKNDRYPEVYGKVMEHGVLAVSKPTSTQMVAQSLRVMCAHAGTAADNGGEAGHGGGQDFRNPSVQPCQVAAHPAGGHL